MIKFKPREKSVAFYKVPFDKFFMWSGEYFRKIENCVNEEYVLDCRSDDDVKKTINNVVNIETGELFYIGEYENVFPTDVEILMKDI